jgi:hypothetical protein
VRNGNFSTTFIERLNAEERNHTLSRPAGLIGGLFGRLGIARTCRVNSQYSVRSLRDLLVADFVSKVRSPFLGNFRPQLLVSIN